ncbi:hypothetical protein X011_13715 [Mycobacterium tuberculosis variant microti OV254]|nr:hypothetical protein X011_13715 [Mycobacterium tuberculosis variant microti OV254]BBX43290.1 hypothetical protein MSIM_47410 [Mycobacterium simiae]
MEIVAFCRERLLADKGYYQFMIRVRSLDRVRSSLARMMDFFASGTYLHVSLGHLVGRRKWEALAASEATDGINPFK